MGVRRGWCVEGGRVRRRGTAEGSGAPGAALCASVRTGPRRVDHAAQSRDRLGGVTTARAGPTPAAHSPRLNLRPC